jgi:hypothetical protein
MSSITRFACPAALLPAIEAALAANDYQISVPLQTNSTGASAMVMAYGTTYILLTHAPASEFAEIEIWGAAQTMVADLLESLPILLYKHADMLAVGSD